MAKNKLTKQQKLTSSLISLVVVIALGFGLWKLMEKPVEAAWFDDAWAYRVRIQINNTGAAVTNQKVKLDIATDALLTAGKIQSDCGDSRFTTASGEILAYYLDTSGGACNTSSTDYYVLIPGINAGATVIYHYYGNPNVPNGTTPAQFAESTFSPNSTSAASEEKSLAPIAYWRFDEGTGSTTYDSSANQNNLTVSGPTWRTKDDCHLGTCLAFNGSSNSLSSTAGTYDSGSYLTVEAWVYVNAKTDFMRFVSKGAPAAANNSFQLLVDSQADQYAYIEVSNGSATQLAKAKNPLPIRQWVHLAGTWDGTAVKLYVNGNLENTRLLSGTLNNSNDSTYPLSIGKAADASSNYLNGQLDDVRIYNYARTANQIRADYMSQGEVDSSSAALGTNVNSSTLAQGLIGYWKMDESSWTNNCSTSTILDSSGNGFHGKACPNSTGPSTIGVGKYGPGGAFDGSDDYGEVANNSLLNPTQFSVAFWVKQNNTPTSFDRIIDKLDNDSNPDSGWTILFNNDVDRKIYMVVRNTSGSDNNVVGTGLTTGTWRHIVTTFDGSLIKIFEDGVFRSSSIMSGTFNPSADVIRFAEDNNSSSAKPAINLDEVRYYSRALSPAEIELLYRYAPGPVSYWNFEEKVGQTVADVSGNSHSTTLGDTSAAGTDDPQRVPGKFGQGLNFDGGDYAGSTTAIGVGKDHPSSYSVWVKPSGTGQYAIIASQPASAGESGKWFGQVALGNRQCGASNLAHAGAVNFVVGNIWNGCASYYTASSTIPAGVWTHVGVVYSGGMTTGAAQIYVNGVLMSNTYYTEGTLGSPTYYDSWRIGASLAGAMDDLRIYNYARTQKEVVSDMNAGHGNVGSPVASAVGQWHFDEGADNTCVGGSNDACNSGSGGSTLDAAQTSMSVPATSTSGWNTNGKYGKALVYDGTSDYLTVTDPASGALDVANSQDFTLSAWVKTSSAAAMTGSQGRIISKRDNGTPNIGYELYVETGTTVPSFVVLGSGGNAQIVGTSNIADSRWHHIVAMRKGNELIMHIDGRQEARATTTITTSLANSTNFYLGQFSRGDADRFWPGYIDEVKFYNYALTADDVKLDYNRGSAIVLGAEDVGQNVSGGAGSTPVGEWKMDEKEGILARDTSGNGNTGTLTLGPTWTRGKIGTAIKFDGSDDYITMGDPAGGELDFGDSVDFSIEGWFNTGAIGSVQTLVAKKTSNGAGTAGYLINITAGGKLNAYVSDGTDQFFRPSSSTLVANTWYHFVFVFDESSSTGSTFWINGIEDSGNSTGTIGNVDSTANSQPFIVGAESDFGSPMQGLIDQVKVYNYARNLSQIAFGYNGGEPMGWWKFDECQGTTAYDSAPNANGGFGGKNGTITPGGSGNTTAGSCESGTSTEMWNDGTSGKINASMGFDGVDDYVVLPAISIPNNQDLSISTWVKLDSAEAGLSSDIFSGCNDPSAPPLCSGADYDGVVLRKDGNDNVQWSIYYQRSGTSRCTYITNTTLPLNQWVHITATYDENDASGVGKIYFNGIAQTLLTDTCSSAVSAATTLYSAIGASKFSNNDASITYVNHMLGQIDDLRLYFYNLEASQVKQIYNNGAVNFSPATGTP